VQYVRGNFFAGEDFVDLADAQVRVEKWCRETAGGRIHGTTAARPAELFAEHEAPALLAVPDPYDVPIFARVKVHRDFHEATATQGAAGAVVAPGDFELDVPHAVVGAPGAVAAA